LDGVVYYCGRDRVDLVVEDGGDDEVRPSLARSAVCLVKRWKEAEDVAV
jgi:hypothetical protein